MPIGQLLLALLQFNQRPQLLLLAWPGDKIYAATSAKSSE
jgi:hypothetical protein